MKENILDYQLTIFEKEALNPYSLDKKTYLQISGENKRLIDLHLLFLMRREKENCKRIKEEIRKLEDVVDCN